MSAWNFEGRQFLPLRNSEGGQVNGDTRFLYHQSGDLLTATYSGGGIRAGSMLGTVAADGQLHFCYHHLTDGGELRSGVCRSRPELLPDGRIRLYESWQWTLGGDLATGESIVEEK
ncbi:hypothetical protein F183_A16640 [Bryobacterales bacterium F-183]|nr:hypothetical protein F183_A16640 [Bryobacterales bacterium F-183]